MSVFADPEAAKTAVQRLEAAAGVPLEGWLQAALEGNADADRALTNLERWAGSTTNPGLHLQQMAGMPRLGNLLLMILGASQPISDALIQNPELASLILEPGEVAKVPRKEQMLAEGTRLLQACTSYTHALDRLRYLKQRYVLPLVLNDLAGNWAQETVWTVISDLADALVTLAWDYVWRDASKRKDLPEKCPVLVVGFGKLSGRELNYSSDVDLVYAVPDGTEEALERECARFCEALGRALSDKMGRGSLYRVDLRLRPYGGTGPIVRSMRSYEAYYQLYAEPWELQALLRSRPICGPEELCVRWEAMRVEHAFKPRLSDVTLEHLIVMRQRIEEGATDQDLKRAAGGIRDVEFHTQVLQMVHGHSLPSLRTRNTIEALKALEREGLLDHSVSESLIEGYTFLRQLEHRLQLVGDRQTHEVPKKPAARESLSRTMGLDSWAQLERVLGQRRRSIGALYRSTFHPDEEANADRGKVRKALGSYGQAALQWFDAFPESDAFYSGLCENEGSLHRVERILQAAPKLVTYFRSSLPLTEMLMSGEIEEESVVTSRLDRLPLDAFPQQVADAHVSAYTTACSRWVLGSNNDLGRELSDIQDSLVRHIAARLDMDVDILALGSYGTQSFGTNSDIDILMLTESREGHRIAEGKGQELVAFVNLLHRLGSPVKVDLRLRPEGGKGLLVRTYEAFAAYDMQGMEMWERFALGQARLVRGSERAMELVRHAAYTVPLTPERLRELTKMKKRIETERVQPQHSRRHVKLGSGGLNDIEWLVHLHEMRYPSVTLAGTVTDVPSRLRRLAQTHLLNSVEVEVLVEAQAHLLTVRNYLDLQGVPDDVLPENPDKLNRLALAIGDRDGHDFLRRHTALTEAVRRLYTESLERLRA